MAGKKKKAVQNEKTMSACNLPKTDHKKINVFARNTVYLTLSQTNFQITARKIYIQEEQTLRQLSFKLKVITVFISNSAVTFKIKWVKVTESSMNVSSLTEVITMHSFKALV